MVLRANLGHVVVSASTVDTERELRKRIEEARSGLVLASDYPEHAMLLEATCPFTGRSAMWGMLCRSGTRGPQIAPHKEISPAGKCWVGFDDCIWLIRLLDAKCDAQVSLGDGCIFQGFVVTHDGLLIVVHELGVLCLDESACELWKIVGSGIVEGYSVCGDLLTVRFEGGDVKQRRTAATDARNRRDPPYIS